MRNRLEDGLQIGVVQLLRLNGYWPVHVPNEGKRSMAGHAVQVAMGLEPGFPDLLVFDRRAPARLRARAALVCAIECKRPPQRAVRRGFRKRVAPNAGQLRVHEELTALGVPVIVAHTLDDVCAGMAAIGSPLKGRAMA